MTAVVEQDERPHLKPGGRYRQQQHNRQRDMDHDVHQDPQRDIRDDGGPDLHHAPSNMRLRVDPKGSLLL